ncbi:MAG: HD-GYP domain-containing protein [Pseudobutyrivibrio sp.]|nr:HD-GYP domain-containing protein [Pseudobutyrivibrio sp.]
MVKLRRFILLISFIFLSLAIGTSVIAHQKDNNRNRTMTFATAKNHESNRSVLSLKITQNGASWTHGILDEEGNETMRFTGEGVDFSIGNYSKGNVKHWGMRIDIPGKMYLNNFWNGIVEIHQFQGSKENIQTIDFRDISQDDIELRQITGDENIMIELNIGDYLVYYPSEEIGEYPIYNANNGRGTVTVGGIFYFDELDIQSFNGTIDYVIVTPLVSQTGFVILLVGAGVWFLFLFFELGYLYRRRRMKTEWDRDQKRLNELMKVFVSFIDAKDTYTAGHSSRVAFYSMKLAEKMGLTTDECMEIYYDGILHDVGKIGISDEILRKPGVLSGKEYEIIKSHTTTGGRMLKSLSTIKTAKSAAMFHHEWYNGKGYPIGLAGDKIPLEARIICVADAFDAMSSARVYRPAMDIDYIKRELRDKSGIQFDPVIAGYMLELIEEDALKNPMDYELPAYPYMQ